MGEQVKNDECSSRKSREEGPRKVGKKLEVGIRTVMVEMVVAVVVVVVTVVVEEEEEKEEEVVVVVV